MVKYYLKIKNMPVWFNLLAYWQAKHRVCYQLTVSRLFLFPHFQNQNHTTVTKFDMYDIQLFKDNVSCITASDLSVLRECHFPWTLHQGTTRGIATEPSFCTLWELTHDSLLPCRPGRFRHLLSGVGSTHQPSSHEACWCQPHTGSPSPV